jgi:hypothetical protein
MIPPLAFILLTEWKDTSKKIGPEVNAVCSHCVIRMLVRIILQRKQFFGNMAQCKNVRKNQNNIDREIRSALNLGNVSYFTVRKAFAFRSPMGKWKD